MLDFSLAALWSGYFPRRDKGIQDCGWLLSEERHAKGIPVLLGTAVWLPVTVVMDSNVSSIVDIVRLHYRCDHSMARRQAIVDGREELESLKGFGVNMRGVTPKLIHSTGQRSGLGKSITEGRAGGIVIGNSISKEFFQAFSHFPEGVSRQIRLAQDQHIASSRRTTPP